jgi:hypothetical protein
MLVNVSINGSVRLMQLYLHNFEECVYYKGHYLPVRKEGDLWFLKVS